MMIIKGMLVGLVFKIRLCVYALLVYFILFVLLAFYHIQVGVFPEPELVKTIMVLESGEKFEIISFRHRKYTDLLCLGPTHGGKAIELQISKLGLPARESLILRSHVWRFILMTEVCDPEKLDFLFEKIIRLAIKLLKFEVDERVVRLPDHLRLGNRDYSGGTDQASSLPDESLFLHEDLVGELSPAPADCFKGKSIMEIKAVRLAITKSIMEQTISQSCPKELERQFSRLRTIDDVLKEMECPKSKDKPHAVTAKFAAKCFQHLYQKMPRWCLSLRYQGFTHGLIASAGSESLFSTADRFLHPKGSFRTQSDVEVFFKKTNEWARGLCARAYTANQKKPWNALGIFTDEELSLMSEVLNNGAIESILKAAQVANMCITYSGNSVPKNQICNTMLKKVRLLVECLGLNLEQISFHRAEALQSDSWSSTGKEDNLLKATRMVNKDVTRSVIAVYTPSGSQGDFSFLSRSTFESFVMACTCQVQNGAGSACACQLAWILRRKRRSIENIIWLSHPKFIRGYQESSSVYLSPTPQSDLQDEYKEHWCSQPTYSESERLSGLTRSSNETQGSSLQEEMLDVTGSGASDSIVVQSSPQILLSSGVVHSHGTECFGISSLIEGSHGQWDGLLDSGQNEPMYGHGGSLQNLSSVLALNGRLQGNGMMDAYSQVSQHVQYPLPITPSSSSSINCLLSGRSVSSDVNREVRMHGGSIQNRSSASNTLPSETVQPFFRLGDQRLSSTDFYGQSLGDQSALPPADSSHFRVLHGGQSEISQSLGCLLPRMSGQSRPQSIQGSLCPNFALSTSSGNFNFLNGCAPHSAAGGLRDNPQDVRMHWGSMQNRSSASNALSSVTVQQPFLRLGDQRLSSTRVYGQLWGDQVALPLADTRNFHLLHGGQSEIRQALGCLGPGQSRPESIQGSFCPTFALSSSAGNFNISNRYVQHSAAGGSQTHTHRERVFADFLPISHHRNFRLKLFFLKIRCF
jgi:hypothetical protein